MNKYEMLTIFSASLSDEQKDAIVDKYAKLMEKNGGKLVVKSPSKSVQKICRLAGLERMVKIEK